MRKNQKEKLIEFIKISFNNKDISESEVMYNIIEYIEELK